MRLALLAEQGHPESSFRSGVTNFVRHMTRWWRERDLPLDVFTYHDGDGVLEEGSVRWIPVRPRTPVEFHGLRVDPWDVVPLANPRLVPRVVEGGYDAVFALAPGMGTQARVAARRLGVPFAILFTTDLPDYAASLVTDGLGEGAVGRAVAGAARVAAWRYLAWLYDRSGTDLVLVPTRAFRDTLLAHADARAEVLGRGSDTLTFPAPADPGPDGRARMLYVGRLDIGQKNLDALCRAVREIESSELVLVGDGDDRPKLEEALADLVADGRVTFTGYLRDPEALRARYLQADLFAFPSLYDTLGQVVVEAQRAGLPVVVRDQGGPQELVLDGETGFVTGSDGAFVERCRELVDDPALRRRMGARAREHAAALPTWDDVMARLEERLTALAHAERTTT